MLHELLNDLIDKNRKQAEALKNVIDVLEEEKQALKENKPELLTELLSKLQKVTASAMVAEAERAKAAEALASFLKCKPVVKDICSHLEEEEANLLKASSADLLKMVISIKQINYILSKQAEEHRFLAELILERLKFMTSSSKDNALTLDRRV